MTKTVEILPDRLSRFLAEVHLRRGVGAGANGKIDVCAMQAAEWLVGGIGDTDAPDCVDPVIRRFMIRLNDACGTRSYNYYKDEWRDELKPYVVRSINTRSGASTIHRRAFMCADWILRTIAPKTFELWADLSPKRRDEALGWAEKLRNVAPIIDKASALAARAVARDAAAVACAADVAYAADAAYGASSVSSAASAADAAYYAAVAYAADAASAASVACARSKSDDFSRWCWDESLAILDRLIKVTESVAA